MGVLEMSDQKYDGNKTNVTPLQRAVREVKIASAERSDVVIDMKEADRARLEILAQALQPVFDDVPLDDERFDFVISSGIQPRLWIDATAHVMMARDRRIYRFVRDTRLGRVILAQDDKVGAIEEAVTKYIAERLHERELAFAGDEIVYRKGVSQNGERLADDTVLYGRDADSTAKKNDPQSNAQADRDEAAKPTTGALDVSDEATVSTTAPKSAVQSQTGVSRLGLFLILAAMAAGAAILVYRGQLFG